MARASRGASRNWDAPHSLCPSAAVLSVETGDGFPWGLDATWSPNVVAVTVAFDIRINGGDWQNIEIIGPVGSPASSSVNPTDYGDFGDFAEFRVRVDDVPGCGAFESNVAGHEIS